MFTYRWNVGGLDSEPEKWTLSLCVIKDIPCLKMFYQCSVNAYTVFEKISTPLEMCPHFMTLQPQVTFLLQLISLLLYKPHSVK